MIHRLLIYALIFWAPVVFSSELPESMLGKWQVTEVHINADASRTPLYAWNDPRIVGRIFTFAPAKFENDTAESLRCLKPTAKIFHMHLDELISKSMAGYGYPAKQAGAKSYDIDNGQKSVQVVQIYCDGGLWNADLGAEGGPEGSWLFSVDANRIMLRWYDETILVLGRMTEKQKPRPSFDCSKANSATEFEICHSVQLSAFDRSVWAAYKLALSQNKSAGNADGSVTRDQRSWLIARNRCHADKICIIASMKKRLDELSTQSATR